MKRLFMNNSINTYLLMIGIGVIYFFLIGEQGVSLQKDSEIYLDISLASMYQPAYILFIHICKLLFGEKIYLECVVLFQGCFAIFSTVYFSQFVQKQFMIKDWEKIIVYILSFLPYAYTLPEEVVTHQIMTEGIAFSLFYIYLVFLLKAILNTEYKSLVVAVVISIMLYYTRSQLIVCFAFDICAFLICYITKKGIKIKTLVITICVFAFSLLIMLGGVKCLYNTSWFHFLDGSQLIDAMLGRVLYVSEEDDVRLFEEKYMQEIFLELRENTKMDGGVYSDIPDDELRWKNILNGTNGAIRSAWKIIGNYCEGHDISISEIERIQTDLTFPLLFDNLWDYIKVMIEMMFAGMVASIFFQKESIYGLCFLITILLYLCGILLAVRCSKINGIDNKCTKLFGFVVLITFINLLFLNAFMFSMQRYVVYTYGLFYISIYLMIRNLYKNDIVYERNQ